MAHKLPESRLSGRRDLSHLEFEPVTRYVRHWPGWATRGSDKHFAPGPPEGLRIMSSKTATWIIAAGAVLMFIGLCFVPAALSESAQADLLELGACQFSLGALVMACGIYAKARVVQSSIASGDFKKEATPSNPRVRGGCDLCGSEAPVVQCKVHQLHLCGSCLAQHYDIRSCAYVPTTRVTNKQGKNLAAKARGA